MPANLPQRAQGRRHSHDNDPQQASDLFAVMQAGQVVQPPLVTTTTGAYAGKSGQYNRAMYGAQYVAQQIIRAGLLAGVTDPATWQDHFARFNKGSVAQPNVRLGLRKS